MKDLTCPSCDTNHDLGHVSYAAATTRYLVCDGCETLLGAHLPSGNGVKGVDLYKFETTDEGAPVIPGAVSEVPDEALEALAAHYGSRYVRDTDTSWETALDQTVSM